MKSLLLTWRNGGLYIGRDHLRCMDMTVDLFWHPRENARPCEIKYQRSISISWDWLPKLCWDYCLPRCRWDEVASEMWTGRYRTLRRISWRFDYHNWTIA